MCGQPCIRVDSTSHCGVEYGIITLNIMKYYHLKYYHLIHFTLKGIANVTETWHYRWFNFLMLEIINQFPATRNVVVHLVKKDIYSLLKKANFNQIKRGNCLKCVCVSVLHRRG